MDFADRSTSQSCSQDSLLLFDALLRVSQTLRLRMNAWLARFDLTDGRHAVLKSLANSAERGCSQAKLAEKLGQSESNVSSLIERMQRDGLVHRLRSEQDRRKKVLLISPSGQQTLSRVEASMSSWALRELNGFSPTSQMTLLSLLKQLGQTLQGGSNADDVPSLKLYSNVESPEAADHPQDPIDDPKSPQFALQKMLLALSVHAGTDSMEKDVA